MLRLYTVLKDILDSRDHLAAPPADPLPPNADAGGAFMPPVFDQGQIGSCTANAALTYRLWLYRKFFAYERDKSVAPDQLTLSRMFFYGQERLIEGDFTEDTGAQSRTMMQVLATVGSCLESEFPYVHDNLYQMPTPKLLASAKKYAGLSYHRILTLDILKSVIVSGYLATLGFLVYESLESAAVAHSGEIVVPDKHETCLGGHEVVIRGYDDTHKCSDGSLGALKLRNSWGQDWGLNGEAWLPYTYLDFLGADSYDLWCAHLGPVWVPKNIPSVTH